MDIYRHGTCFIGTSSPTVEKAQNSSERSGCIRHSGQVTGKENVARAADIRQALGTASDWEGASGVELVYSMGKEGLENRKHHEINTQSRKKI